jgi:hypothetical protein
MHETYMSLLEKKYGLAPSSISCYHWMLLLCPEKQGGEYFAFTLGFL